MLVPAPEAQLDNIRSGEAQQAIPITLSATSGPGQNMATETIIDGVERNSQYTTSTVRYTRSLRGILLSETHAFGNTTTFNYDTPSRMTSTSSALARVHFGYDDFGRLATETLTDLTNQRSMVTRFTYDDKDGEMKRTFEAQGFTTLTITQDYSATNQMTNMALYEGSSGPSSNPSNQRCGTIPATFSHTRIDHTHERPPHTQTCAQEARCCDPGQSRRAA